ncbi:MAG: TonB-dependent receptor [Ignavibacteriaceae bacterium]|nr:TonB-dependent receptor [Ignavibacteriaceae bacterium]
MALLWKILAILLLFCLNLQIAGQSKEYNISGFVKDAVTGEVLMGANILLYKDSLSTGSRHYMGTVSNNYGFYVFPKLPRGNYYIIARFIGFKTTVKELQDLRMNNIHLNIDLSPEEIKKEEIVITGKKPDKTLISNIDVSPDLLSRLPSLSGESDLFKLLQMLPGVKAESELSSGLYVRGGSPDQNLTIVDGVTEYNPAHIGNIASTFNSDAIQEIRLIKGAFPAEYGGRLSSILDIKLRSGTKEMNKGSLGIGLINSFLNLEGPIGNNATYMISGRGMYYDAYQKEFNKNSVIPRYNFYDLNSKINYVISEDNIFSISLLKSKDNLSSPPSVPDINYNTQWDNLSMGINWLHINSRSLLLSTDLSFIDYSFRTLIFNNSAQSITDNYFASSRLRDYSLKQNVELHVHESHILKTGFEMTVHQYNLLYSTAYNPLIEVDPYAGNNPYSIEAALYFQTESHLTEQLKLNAGARLYYFGEKKYFNAEPRIELAYSLTENTLIKAAYALTHQFLHLITRNDISLPSDLWYPSTKNIFPSSSGQYVFGFDHYFDEQDYLLSVETYYRNMDNLYEFKNSVQLNSANNSVEDELVNGKGEAYGLEFFFNKKAGNISGWVGYTLSWTRRQFDDLNDGKIFYPKYDRRHDISLVIAWMINNRWSAGMTWTYASGERYSFANGQYQFNEISPGSGSNIYVDYPELNNAQLPAFHKLDLNLTYKFPLFNLPFEAYINIYNLYNRQNPFAQYVSTETDNNGNKTVKLKQLVLFPFIPTFGFNFKF